MTFKPLCTMMYSLVFAFVLLTLSGSSFADEPSKTVKTVPAQKDSENKKPAKDSSAKWTVLSGEWEACEFGGDGEITITEKQITMDYGDPITGVRWEGDVIRDNYEIELTGRRIEGFDFFCALTFPVGEKGKASLVLGGWGGGTMGISSIDDRDASDNETTMFRDFKNNQWYTARVRVEETRIAVWIDDTLQFDHAREGHTFDIRYEMDPCLPIGLACFQSKSEIKNVRVRKLGKHELGKELKSKKPEAKNTDAKPVVTEESTDDEEPEAAKQGVQSASKAAVQ